MIYRMKCLPGDESRILVTREFVEKNRFSINKYAARNICIEHGSDFLGFKFEVASEFLPYEEIKLLLNEEYKEKIESGKEYPYIDDVMEAVQDFLDYMVFAWMKAMDGREISASRSIAKLSAWMNILNRSDIADVLENDMYYHPYGRPALKKACKMLDIDVPDYL